VLGMLHGVDQYLPQVFPRLNPFPHCGVPLLYVRVIPMVEFRKRLPVNQYEASGAIDLVEANESINVALMNLNTMIHFQAFDQPYETGGLKPEDWGKIKIGPNKYLHLPEGATAGLLGFNPKIVESVEAIRFQMQAIQRMYNLNMAWSIDQQPASGFSLVVQNIDLLEARQRDIEIYKVYEQKIYDVLTKMQEYYSRVGMLDSKEPRLPMDGDLNIDFQEWQFPINQAEEQARWDWEIEKNIATPIDYIQSKEGLSEEEARERWEINKKVNQRYSMREALRQRIQEEGGAVLPGGNLENES